MLNKFQRVGALLPDEPGEMGVFTPDERMTGWPSSRKKANTWVLCMIINYQTDAWKIWDRGIRLVTEGLGDPEDLWATIAGYQEQDWCNLCRERSVHRLSQAHRRIWRIAGELSGVYGDDARAIWNGQIPEEVLRRLNEMRFGKEISKLIVGKLQDSGILTGKADVKADVHVRRVLGRVFDGGKCSADRAAKISSRIRPSNPWGIDGALWNIGTTFCHPESPECDDCPLISECKYSVKKP